MDKMNQVSVTEFMSKSKEEMYDMAVEMVEKYNRLVDICNDSAERIAELIERHKVYTSALKNDIADKEAKIDMLEKEIEGRKKAFNELKEEMANRYITIENHDDICKTYENKVDELKEEVNKLNKCIMEKNESIDTGNEAIINLRKQIGVHVEENKRLSDKIMKLNDTITGLSHEIDNYKSWNASLHEDIKYLNKKVDRQRENLNAINRTIEIKTKENYRLITVKNNQEKEIEAHEAENARLSEKIMELKKERDKHMARVNDLRMELDCVKASKEKHEEAAHEKLVEGLRENIGYWRNKYVAAQEEIDKLDGDLADVKNQTESFIKELKDENARLEKLKKKEDDHGREGFERYIKYIISTEETKFKAELNRKFSEEVSKISTKRTEEELAKMKGVPCGEDSIE